MKNLLMILFLVFSFQVLATESEESEGSQEQLVGQVDESMIDCTDQHDLGRRGEDYNNPENPGAKDSGDGSTEK